ncbi:hypothetical protein Holit_00383 [Hollandina sp. SP2]
MQSDEVAKLTGYSKSTVRKYAPLLAIKYLGSGRGKIYDWTQEDMHRFLTAIQGAGSRRDQRGRPQKK